MQALLSAKNLSCEPSVSVFCDGNPLFCDIIKSTAAPFRLCNAGSRSIAVLNSRSKMIFDLWLPVAPGERYILEIYDSGCLFKSLP